MTTTNNQELLLENFACTKTPVSVYLINGIRLQGTIEAQDRYTVVLKNGEVSQLIYKHAITTILPSSNLVEFKKSAEKTAETT